MRFCVVHALQVRATGAQQSPYIENLKKAEERAQLGGLGVWTKVTLHMMCAHCLDVSRSMLSAARAARSAHRRTRAAQASAPLRLGPHRRRTPLLALALARAGPVCCLCALPGCPHPMWPCTPAPCHPLPQPNVAMRCCCRLPPAALLLLPPQDSVLQAAVVRDVQPADGEWCLG